MSSNILPFEYGEHQVRTVVVNDEPWFVLADLCRVLDISNPSAVAARLEDDERNTLRLTEGIGRGNPNVTVVNEPGMYQVILRSDKPEARQFRWWITHEVIPSIRQTGAYSAPAQTEDEIVLRALTILKTKTEALEAKVAEDAPKVEYVDTFVADEDLTILRNVAKPLGIGEAQLRQALIGHRWIYKEETKRWSDKEQKKVPYYRYSPYADKRDYFRCVKNHDAPRFKDEIQHTLKVTPQGAAAIARMAKQWGLIA